MRQASCGRMLIIQFTSHPVLWGVAGGGYVSQYSVLPGRLRIAGRYPLENRGVCAVQSALKRESYVCLAYLSVELPPLNCSPLALVSIHALLGVCCKLGTP